MSDSGGVLLIRLLQGSPAAPGQLPFVLPLETATLDRGIKWGAGTEGGKDSRSYLNTVTNQLYLHYDIWSPINTFVHP